MKYYPQQEKKDLLVFFTLSLLTPITWMLLYGWNQYLQICSNDGIMGTQPILSAFSELGGNWKNFLFWLTPIGGTLGTDIAGIVPFYEWAFHLGFNHFSIEILSVFFLQIVYGFFGFKIFEAIYSAISDKNRTLSPPWYAMVAWVCAFQPFMAWRIYYGHELLLQGLLVFLVATSLYLTSFFSKISFTTLAIALIALVNAYPSSGQQTIFYGALFGAPILIGATVDFSRQKKRSLLGPIGFTFCCLFAGLFLVFPRFFSMVKNALGQDLSRSLSTSVLTYSYITASFNDFFTSFPTSFGWIVPDRGNFFWHEVNFGFGASIILFPLLAKYKFRYLSLGLMVSFFLAWAFAMDLKPISSTLLSMIPLLGSFRVPHRALLPFVALILPLSLSVIFKVMMETREEWQGKIKFPLTLIALVPILSFAGMQFESGPYEPIIWVCIILMVILFFKKNNFLEKWRSHIALSGLIGLVVLQFIGFGQRALPMQDRDALYSYMHMLKKNVFAQDEQMENPLNRSKFNFFYPSFNMNSALAAGLSSTDGYMFPLSRYSKLMAALALQKYDPTQNSFFFNSTSNEFRVISNLYNLKNFVALEGTQVKLLPNSETIGPAWFVAETKTYSDFETLGNTLRKLKSPTQELRKTAFFLKDDYPTGLWAENSSCLGSKVKKIQATYQSPVVSIEAESSENCLLILSLNYSKKLVARDQSGNLLQLLPVYGALTGIWLKNGIDKNSMQTWKIQIQGENQFPLWVEKMPWLGWMLVGLLALTIQKKRFVEIRPN